MKRIIEAIEKEFEAKETTIFLLKHENENLKRELKARDERIAELEKRGEKNADNVW